MLLWGWLLDKVMKLPYVIGIKPDALYVLGQEFCLQVHAGTEIAFISSCLHLLKPKHIFTKLQFIIQPVRLQFRFYLFDNVWMKCWECATRTEALVKAQKQTARKALALKEAHCPAEPKDSELFLWQLRFFSELHTLSGAKLVTFHWLSVSRNRHTTCEVPNQRTGSGRTMTDIFNPSIESFLSLDSRTVLNIKFFIAMAHNTLHLLSEMHLFACSLRYDVCIFPINGNHVIHPTNKSLQKVINENKSHIYIHQRNIVLSSVLTQRL